jgi:hypothetical protein
MGSGRTRQARLVVPGDATVEADRSVFFTFNRVGRQGHHARRVRLCAPASRHQGDDRMSAASVKVKLRDGWSVFDGKQQRSGGETVETDPETAQAWEAAGWVEPVKASTRRR